MEEGRRKQAKGISERKVKQSKRQGKEERTYRKGDEKWKNETK